MMNNNKILGKGEIRSCKLQRSELGKKLNKVKTIRKKLNKVKTLVYKICLDKVINFEFQKHRRDLH